MVPLALSSPFWEGLVVVLIFGLLSSTFLVITVFPYYYLGAEYVRLRVSRRACLTWLGLSIALTVALSMSSAKSIAPLAPLLVLAGQIFVARTRKRRRAA